jgi:hypothetical protein
MSLISSDYVSHNIQTAVSVVGKECTVINAVFSLQATQQVPCFSCCNLVHLVGLEPKGSGQGSNDRYIGFAQLPYENENALSRFSVLDA